MIEGKTLHYIPHPCDIDNIKKHRKPKERREGIGIMPHSKYNQDTNLVSEPNSGHAAGEIVLVVARVSLVPGVGNDTMEMWINPLLGLGERQGAVTVTALNDGDDINPAHGITEFSLQTANNASSYEIDEIRIGATWASVTPATIIVVPPTSAQNWLLYN